MLYVEWTLALYLLAAVQLFGIGSAALARLTEGSHWQSLCQRTFLGAMTASGAATAASLFAGIGSCLLCGFALAIMALVAVTDLGAGNRQLRAF